MDFPVTLIDLAGTISLLLWGVHMVQTGIQRGFGPKLGLILAAALRDRFRAFLAGVGVTACLQSSTATGLMLTGFAAGGFVELIPALAVMLGANVGTTLIVQVLSVDIAALAPCLFLIGLVMFSRGEATRTRDLGRVAIGLGLMLLSLHQLLEVITPYEDVPSLRLLMGTMATQPVFALLVAAIITWAAHSSVAIVLLVSMLFAAKASVVLAAGAAFAQATGRQSRHRDQSAAGGDDRRRSGGETVADRQSGEPRAWLRHWPRRPAGDQSLGRFHRAGQRPSGRRLPHRLQSAAGGCVFSIADALCRYPAPLVPRPDRSRADPSQPIYLHRTKATDVPSVAIGAATREALRLVDVLDTMLQSARDAFEHGDRKQIAQTKRLDDVLDKLNTAIKSYLGALDNEAMSDADHQRVEDILTFAHNLEYAGDIVEQNLMGHASKRLRRGLGFSAEGQAGLTAALNRLIGNLHAAAAVFVTDDIKAARMLAAEKEAFRDMEATATQDHFARLRRWHVAVDRGQRAATRRAA